MITQELLKTLLEYDPSNGLFTWIVDKGTIKSGNIAGCKRPNGYITIKINQRCYLAHRLIWLYVYGYFPKSQIDHINCMRSDNRLSNLREATNTENNINQYKKKSNTSGYKGVCWVKDENNWLAQIRVNGKKMRLGQFKNVEDAANAYREAALKYHGDFAKF